MEVFPHAQTRATTTNNHGVRPSHPIIFMATLYTFIIIMASAL